MGTKFGKTYTKGEILKSIIVTLSSGVSNRFDPVGVRYIISVIENNSHDILFLQDRIVTRDKILDYIKELRADLLWLSVQPDTENLLDFIQKIKKIYNGVIIVGNIGSRWITKNNLIMLDANIIIVSGQGEDAAKQLIQLYNNSILSIKTSHLQIQHLKVANSP